jgi:hypothetical protein
MALSHCLNGRVSGGDEEDEIALSRFPAAVIISAARWCR